jgi:hypothetical protein
MNKLIFLPVDIDLTEFIFTRHNHSLEKNIFNLWWSASVISNNCVEKNNFKKILDQLPFTRITRITHKIQTNIVHPHVDVMKEMGLEDGEYQHLLNNEPCGYRIVIVGQNDKLKVHNGVEWVTAKLPEIPGCYLLDSITGLHKVDDDQNREIIYIRGFLDPIKHKEIINRSLEKYKNYAIYHQQEK